VYQHTVNSSHHLRRQVQRFPARRVGFFAVCLAYCMIILDGSVLNVAVPAIRDDMHTSMASVQWVLDAYTLPLAGLLLTAGVLGDRFGLRRMLLAGTVVFTAASAACAGAPDTGALIAERARAAVVWVAAGSLSVAAGPLVGGWPLLLYRRLSERYGHAAMLLSGFACAAAGSAVLGLITVSGSYPVAFAGLLLVGGASTISFSALTSLLMQHVPADRSGLASGLQNTTRQSGALVAVSVIGSVLNAADPAGRMAASFVITGVAAVIGVTCGVLALIKQDAASNPPAAAGA
jgi:MFS family permease